MNKANWNQINFTYSSVNVNPWLSGVIWNGICSTLRLLSLHSEATPEQKQVSQPSILVTLRPNVPLLQRLQELPSTLTWNIKTLFSNWKRRRQVCYSMWGLKLRHFVWRCRIGATSSTIWRYPQGETHICLHDRNYLTSTSIVYAFIVDGASRITLAWGRCYTSENTWLAVSWISCVSRKAIFAKLSGRVVSAVL